MRKRAFKLREFPLGGAKANSTYIGAYLQNYFVVGDSQNKVRLYTFENQEQIQVYANQNNQSVQTEVTSVAMNCSENQIFSGTNRGIINVWDMETAKTAALLKGHPTSVNCFGIYPEEPHKLVSGSYDTMIKMWDVRDKNCTATLKGHNQQINSLSISPDGNLLLSGSEDCTARLWDLRTSQRPIYVANQHSGPVLKVKFNPEDCMFATCSSDRTAKYFRCEDRCFGFASSTDLVSTPITSIAFSEDGKVLFTAANDLLKTWNMYKGGVLLDQIETSWKGVQDMAMIQDALMGVAYSSGHLSLWIWDAKQKIKNSSKVAESQASFVLPKIGTKYSKKQNQVSVNELQNIVDFAVQKVGKIKEKNDDEKKQEQEKKKADMEKKKEEMLKRKEQEQRRQKQIQAEKERQRQRILLEKMIREKEQKERKEQERKRMEEEQKRQEQRLYNERQAREKEIQARLKQTFEEHDHSNTMEYDNLENSLNMNISCFLSDGAQKQKLRQVELIGQIMKDKSKFESMLRDKTNAIKPIINYWKKGQQKSALELLSKSNQIVKSQCITAIVTTPIFKQNLQIEYGTILTQQLNDMMKNSKHSIYVTTAMQNIDRIVLIFKDELIRIKNFKPMAKVDLKLEERLAKYDKMIEEFMNVFRTDRLKKYSDRKKQGQSDELCNTAFDLYKHLEEVLIKIMPKEEPQLA